MESNFEVEMLFLVESNTGSNGFRHVPPHISVRIHRSKNGSSNSTNKFHECQSSSYEYHSKLQFLFLLVKC